MNKLKLQKLRETFFPKKNFGLRMLLLLLGITGMGFSMSLLLKVRFGGDPYTVLMNAVAERTGFPIGNTCALFNMATFLAVLPAGIGYFGFGTLANMFLFGYSLQFFNWAMAGILPESMFRTMPVRVTAFIPAFVLFILSTSLYMVVRLGTSPYDAVPILVARRIKKFRFAWSAWHSISLWC
jgi:uncharacterized membrane protein YczE